MKGFKRYKLPIIKYVSHRVYSTGNIVNYHSNFVTTLTVNVKSLSCMPETNVMLYVNYVSVYALLDLFF